MQIDIGSKNDFKPLYVSACAYVAFMKWNMHIFQFKLANRSNGRTWCCELIKMLSPWRLGRWYVALLLIIFVLCFYNNDIRVCDSNTLFSNGNEKWKWIINYTRMGKMMWSITKRSTFCESNSGVVHRWQTFW